MRPRVLVLDNYDSFVYNLVQYLGELGSDPIVHRHDALNLDEIFALDPDAILISPGPGTPDDADPLISLIAPTGSPPSNNSSASSIPVDATSRIVRGAGVNADG